MSLSTWFEGALNSLPKPTGERKGVQGTARKTEMPSKEEMERESNIGLDCENVSRMPGWKIFETELARQISDCQHQLECAEFGTSNEGLKATQVRLRTLRECAAWMGDQIKRGEEARSALTGGKK